MESLVELGKGEPVGDEFLNREFPGVDDSDGLFHRRPTRSQGAYNLQLLEHDLVDQPAVLGEIAFWTESTIFGREVSKATGCFFFPARTPVVDY